MEGSITPARLGLGREAVCCVGEGEPGPQTSERDLEGTPARISSSTYSRARPASPVSRGVTATLDQLEDSPPNPEIDIFTSHDARRWEPKRLRLRLLAIPALIARTERCAWLRFAERAPWACVSAPRHRSHPPSPPDAREASNSVHRVGTYLMARVRILRIAARRGTLLCSHQVPRTSYRPDSGKPEHRGPQDRLRHIEY